MLKSIEKISISETKNNNLIMVHLKMKLNEPSVAILARNPLTGSYEETKVYEKRGKKGEDVIYLQNGTTFSFNFFNPTKDKIGIKLFFNGNSTEDMLVLNPGQNTNLERFINESKKFLFETYEVDGKNSTVQKAIEDNGNIKVEFYKEMNYQPYTYTYTYIQNYPNYNQNYPNFLGDEFYTTCCDMTLGNPPFQDTLETGRVEKGEESNQQFKTTYANFEFTPFLVKEIKLLPPSQNKGEKIRNYCENCGYRIRNKSWLFCPKCGNKFE